MSEKRKAPLERWLELGLFQARWLMAPFYVGLVLALGVLVVVFIKEVIHELEHVATMTSDQAVVLSLSLIDMSLAGSLLMIVIFSGYESFVSKLDVDHEDRPDWMGKVDFSGLKMKLIASLVAITAVALLRALLRRAGGEVSIDDAALAWLVGIHITFVVSGVLLALMDFLISKSSRH